MFVVPPHTKKLHKTAIPMMMHGASVENMPKDKPEIITVPEPVSEDFASFLVGLYVSEVKNSVVKPIKIPAIRPTESDTNSFSHCGKNFSII